MSDKVKLELKPDDLHTLSLAGQRKGGATTKVLKDQLNKLLVDHTRLINYIGKEHLEGWT
jgi:hypothetical protein